MTNKELQFALDKALEVAKEKDREIRDLRFNLDKTLEIQKVINSEMKKLNEENQRLINCMAFESTANTIDSESDVYEVGFTNYDPQIRRINAFRNPSVGIHPPTHTSARMTISAIIGIAAGFILALILL